MNRDEFDLLIEPLKLSMLDTVTPPTLDDYTEALAVVRQRRKAREIREHLKVLRDREYPLDSHYGGGGFIYQGSFGNGMYRTAQADNGVWVMDNEGIGHYEQPTHGDKAGTQQDQTGREKT